MSLDLDADALARFLTAPDAGRLVAAYARIPQGPLREAGVVHLERLAAFCEEVEPYVALAGLADRVEAEQFVEELAPSPRPRIDSAESTAVVMRKDGCGPLQIAEATGLSASQVKRIVRKAEAEGMTFPPLRRAPAAPAKPKTPRPDPRGRLPLFPLKAEDLTTPQLRTMIPRAAEQRGMSVETFLAQRRAVIRLAQDGKTPQEIAEATGEDIKTIYNWARAARIAGIPVPQFTDGRGT